ncbi:MAG: protein kinase [Deltaproteobacteria bacterium]|nr:protein kinase [Deltaproteobacteria bacterium]
MTELAVGARVGGRYEVRREIARGGMCVVYCARDLPTGRDVALKVLREELVQDPDAGRRLQREAKALQLCRGPNVVELLATGVQDRGAPYLVMEMLEGRTLEGILASRGTLSIDDTVQVGAAMCSALARVHDHNVVHRDLKPGNIVLVARAKGEFEPCLIDFGISALVEPGTSPTTTALADAKITSAGEFFGTPEYVAPEVVQRPGVIDRRSDVYSLGVTLYECLTGTVPYSGGFCEVAVKVLLASAPPDAAMKRPAVDPTLSAAISRAMAASADKRYGSALQMQEALESWMKARGNLVASLPSTVPPARTIVSLGPAAEPAGVQRRRYPRAPYVTPVRIVAAGATPVRGRTEDVSEGGLLVLAESQCPNNARVWVYFTSPITGSAVGAEATTRWVRDAHGKAAVGLEFMTLAHPVRREIAQYVERESGR